MDSSFLRREPRKRSGTGKGSWMTCSMKMIFMIGIGAVAAISFGSEPIGYLAKIGPAPLRFQSAPKGPEVTVILPPLKMSEPPAELREVTTNLIATVETPV